MATPTNKSKDLPQDIITDILTRLPVKSLMRFKCVCKHWNQLITKSRFPFWVLDRYLDCNHSETNCSHREPNIIIVSNKRCQYGHQDGEPNAKIFCIGGAAKEDSFKIATEITDDPFEIKTNACDGMLCLVSEDQNLLLWNPATREHKALPLPISDGRAFCRGVCGLGLDDSIDDYKVVSLFNGEIYVFSVKRNVWKVAGAFKNWICDEPVAANGCLYWIAGKGFGFSEKLLCLDLSNDKYWEVPLPLLDQPNTRSPRRGPNGSHRCDLTLFLSGRNLCMFRGRDHGIWMLEVAKEAEEQKENHDGGGDAEMVERESWRKLMVLPKLQIQENEDNPILEQGFSKLSPKCFTNSGKLVICTNYFKLVMYNPEDGSYEDLEIPGLVRGLWKRVIPYVESLIAPTSIRGLNDID